MSNIGSFLQEVYEIVSELQKSKDEIQDILFDIISALEANEMVDTEELKLSLGEDPVVDDVIEEYLSSYEEDDDEDDEDEDYE